MRKSQPLTAGITPVSGSEAGFSLLELAIVMVIIGLLVSGVLVGQDMIKAATLRSQLTQFSDYDTAVNTFNSKYGGIPGDYSQSAAIVAGVAHNDATKVGQGDGNGLVQSSSTVTNAAPYGVNGEPTLFWTELSLEKLIPQAIAITDFTGDVAIGNATIPPAKIGGGNSISVGSDGTYNYYLLAKYSGTFQQGTLGTVAAGLTTGQALSLDEKIDDGVPDTGIVISTAQATGDPSAAAGSGTTATAGTCYIQGVSNATSAYDAGNFNSAQCTLAIRTSF